MPKPKIRYTITMQEGDRAVTAYIEAKRPLVGNESVLLERFGALEQLMDDQDDDYMGILRDFIHNQPRKELEDATNHSLRQ